VRKANGAMRTSPSREASTSIDARRGSRCAETSSHGGGQNQRAEHDVRRIRPDSASRGAGLRFECLSAPGTRGCRASDRTRRRSR
jgi:hypothetical protein